MKTPLFLALAALCAASSIAHAQTVENKGDGAQLRDIPNIGPLFRAPITPAAPGNSLFGLEMPPRPQLGANNQPRLRLSVLPSPQGEILQLEAVRQSRAAILRKITDVMGARAVIDPQLEKNWEITQVFRGLNWDELLSSMNYGVEMVKSPAGTYFFADKPIAESAFRTPLDFDTQPPAFADPSAKLREDPRYDPFVIPYGGLNPNLKGWGVEPQPQPDWQKREFNGHEFYYIPMPTAPRPSN